MKSFLSNSNKPTKYEFSTVFNFYILLPERVSYISLPPNSCLLYKYNLLHKLVTG